MRSDLQRSPGRLVRRFEERLAGHKTRGASQMVWTRIILLRGNVGAAQASLDTAVCKEGRPAVGAVCRKTSCTVQGAGAGKEVYSQYSAN